jgi:hypothetical protein
MVVFTTVQWAAVAVALSSLGADETRTFRTMAATPKANAICA